MFMLMSVKFILVYVNYLLVNHYLGLDVRSEFVSWSIIDCVAAWLCFVQVLLTEIVLSVGCFITEFIATNLISITDGQFTTGVTFKYFVLIAHLLWVMYIY